jgi:hypothetical protein
MAVRKTGPLWWWVRALIFRTLPFLCPFAQHVILVNRLERLAPRSVTLFERVVQAWRNASRSRERGVRSNAGISLRLERPTAPTQPRTVT